MFVLPRLKVSLTCKLSIGYMQLSKRFSPNYFQGKNPRTEVQVVSHQRQTHLRLSLRGARNEPNVHIGRPVWTISNHFTVISPRILYEKKQINCMHILHLLCLKSVFIYIRQLTNYSKRLDFCFLHIQFQNKIVEMNATSHHHIPLVITVRTTDQYNTGLCLQWPAVKLAKWRIWIAKMAVNLMCSILRAGPRKPWNKSLIIYVYILWSSKESLKYKTYKALINNHDQSTI